MVVRIKIQIPFNNPIAKVVKTGLTKHEAIYLSKILQASKCNKNFEYFCRVTDNNKEGDFVFWSDLRQCISKK